jgi:hypothetical protein
MFSKLKKLTRESWFFKPKWTTTQQDPAVWLDNNINIIICIKQEIVQFIHYTLSQQILLSAYVLVMWMLYSTQL